jgi:hypothetical protein
MLRGRNVTAPIGIRYSARAGNQTGASRGGLRLLARLRNQPFE